MKKHIIILFTLLSITAQAFAFEMAETIACTYPGASIDQYTVSDNGNGEVLIYWDVSLGAQPSQAALEAAWPACELAKVKRSKITEVKQEGLARIQVSLPGIETFEALQAYREFILSVKPEARQLTTPVQAASDTWTAGSDAIETVNGYVNVGQVGGYDVVNGPAWP